jgi:hypothetical protein
MTDQDLTAHSWTQLREAAAAVEREVARREAQDQADRAEAFAREVDEVRAGTRRADPEHVRALTPQETLEAINRGQLLHAGIAPDRRLRRGQR